MGVWIDTDMGFDDIAALFVVEHSGLAIDGVSLVFGNAPLAQVRRNAARRGAGLRLALSHSMAGARRPVLGGTETAERVLGETGIPTAGPIPAGRACTAGRATPSRRSATGWKAERQSDASWRSGR